MNHPVIMLTAMYRNELLQLENRPSAVQVKQVLTTTNPHTWVFGHKRLLKKALRENFDIQNQKHMLQVIDELTVSILDEGTLFYGLIALYLQNPAEFPTLTTAQVQAYFAEECKALPDDNALLRIWQALCPTVPKAEFLKMVQENLLHYFMPENKEEKTALLSMFEESHSLLPLTEGMSTTAFHLSRIVSIVADCAACGYIPEEQAKSLLDQYETLTTSLFTNWQAFLASAILGKQWMSWAHGQFIVDAKDYTNACLELAAHPMKPLELSGLWVGSNTQALLDCFSYRT